jgi:transcriptional regulator with XRE-family HTH domain
LFKETGRKEKDSNIILGRYIQALVRQRGMNQVQVAEAADISEGHMAQLVAGTRGGSKELLMRVARILGVNPPYRIFAILDKDGEPGDVVNTIPGERLVVIPPILTEEPEDRAALDEYIDYLAARRLRRRIGQRDDLPDIISMLHNRGPMSQADKDKLAAFLQEILPITLVGSGAERERSVNGNIAS